MPAFGIYNGTVVETDHPFQKDQRLLLIPVESGPVKPDPRKIALVEKLYGSVPDQGFSLEETRQERLARQ